MNGKQATPHTDLAKTLVIGAALIVLLWFLYQIQQVVLLFLVALIFALAINAPVTWLEDRGIHRGWGTLLAAIVLLLLVACAAWIAIPRLFAAIPRLIDESPESIARIADRLAAFFGDHPVIEQRIQLGLQTALSGLGDYEAYLDPLIEMAVLAPFVVAMIIFIVAKPRPILSTYIRVFPPASRDRAAHAFTRASRMVVGWAYSSLILGSMKAIAAFAFLGFLGVPGTPLWSALAFFAALIPRVGVLLMTIPPAIAALSIDATTALWVVLFFWGFSELLGNFVAPRIYEQTMELHPVYILVTTLAIAYAFGILAALVAPPIAGFARTYFDEFYLSARPPDPDGERRIDRMLRRVSTR